MSDTNSVFYYRCLACFNVHHRSIILGSILLMHIGLFIGCNKQEARDATIAVSALVPITGPGSEMGPQSKNGFQLFFRENPKLLEHTVEVFVEDNKGTVKDGLTAYRSLSSKTRKEPILLITQLSSIAVAVGAEVESSSTVQFGLAATPTLLKYSRSIRNYVSAARLGKAMCDVLQDAKIDNVAIFYLSDDYGLSVASAFKETASLINLKIVSETSFANDLRDVSAIVAKSLDSKPAAIVVVGFGATPIQIIRRIREQGYQGTIVADPAAGFRPYAKMIGSTSEGLWLVDLAYPSDNQEQTEFIHRYEKLFGNKPDIPAALVYSGCQVFAEAVRLANSVNPQEVLAVLSQGFNVKTLLGPTKVEKRDIVYPLVTKRIVNGEAVVFAPETFRK